MWKTLFTTYYDELLIVFVVFSPFTISNYFVKKWFYHLLLVSLFSFFYQLL